MLQIKNLSIFLREDSRTIIKDFNFTLNRGDKIGLIGEEGNGKSILLKAIYHPEKLEESCDIFGEIVIKDEILGYLPQGIDPFYLGMTTAEYFKHHLTEMIIDYTQMYQYLSQFLLSDEIVFSDLKVRELSGGEKIKFALLIELLKQPTVFLFDEPNNDLDMDSQIWLENFMNDLNIPFIFVSHDTTLLSKIANGIIHIEQIHRRTEARHTISRLTYDEYVSQREQSLLIQSKRFVKEQEEFEKKTARYRRVYDAVQHGLRNTKNDIVGKNLKDKMHSLKSMGRRLDKEKAELTQKPVSEEAIDILFNDEIYIPNGKTVLDFKLDKLNIGHKVLSQDIKLQIIGPEKICIIGKNGAGKTTLLKKILKEFVDLNQSFAYMPQDYFESEKKNINALEYLSNTGSIEHTKASTILGTLNFKREEMFRPIQRLSGGQKAKLFFAKIELDQAEILILDEPTRNLSPLSQPEVIEALKNYKGAIIAVSHDRYFIQQVFDKVYELDQAGLHRIK